jgi:outer membrane lipoprotein-sorting protein
MRRQPGARIINVTKSRRVTLAVVLAALMLCTAAARDLFDEIYARSHAVEASLRTVTARFTEETTSSLLSTPVVSRGTLAVIRPDRIIMRYSDPAGRILLIDGDRLTIVWPSRGVKDTSNIGEARRRIDKYFVDKSPNELRRSFTIAARIAPERATPNSWEVAMTPTRSQIRQGLAGLTLWIDRTSMMLRTMRMEFPSGDIKTLTFDDVAVNKPVDPRTFSIE